MKDSLPRPPKQGLFQRIFGSSSQASVGRQQLHDLVNLLGSTADTVGEDFFRSIAEQLAEVLGVRHCVLSKILPGSPIRLITLAHFLDGELNENLEFFADGTPAGLAIENGSYYCPSGIQSRFPDDHSVAHLSDGCCLGIAILGQDGAAIGHLSIYDTQPLEEPEFAEKVLRLFAGRASAELAREQAVAESHQSLQRLETFSNELPGWVFAYEDYSDGGRKFLFSNDHCIELLGPETSTEILANPRQYRERIHPDDIAQVMTQMKSSRALNGPIRVDYRIRTDGDIYRWVRIIGRFTGETEEVKTMHGILVDIEAEMQLTRHAAELTSQLEILIESVPIAVVLKDASGVIQFLNQRAQKLLQLEGIHWIGQKVEEITGLPENTKHALAEASACEQKAWRKRERVDCKIFKKIDGQTTQQALDCSWIPLIDNSGIPFGGITTLRDITDILEEEELQKHRLEVDQRDRRMDALGRLAEGVSHEFENLLTAVHGYSDICLSRIALQETPSESIRKPLEQIQAAASKASGLARSLLAFSARKHWKGESCDPSKILQEFEPSLGHLAGPQIQFRLKAQLANGNVPMSREGLADILVHLITNARASMDSIGEIQMTGRIIESDTPLTWKGHALPPGCYYRIDVQDNGIGIAPADLGRIFDPFFSTSLEVRGKGMGLAMVFGLVQKAEGGIQVQSEIGTGTCMQIFLPLTPSKESAEVSNQPKPLNILVVEDQKPLLDLFSEILQAGKHETTLADDSQTAMEQISNSTEINLLVSDVCLPDGTGPELLQKIHLHRPNLPAIFFSGSPRSVLLAQGIEIPANTPLLSKPFRPTQLLQTIATLMESTK